ncbi:MAG: sugar phosphate isomerase/epimerase [Clostridia bacterium]|nr:sugar phosphate isomerase/epimerase [Clostridia bacterium]
MKLGFLTGGLGDMPLKDKIDWAYETGFEAIEVSCWPKINSRDYSACDMDVNILDETQSKELLQYLQDREMSISSLAYYDNNLDEDLRERDSRIQHLKKVIDAAHLLNVELVGTFVGRNKSLSLEDNFKLFKEVFSDILDYAQKRNIKIMIENCPMPCWSNDGLAGTISYSPELWHEMFKELPNKNFGLNFDPSHLVWLQVDYLQALKDFKDRIFHIHAKDTKLVKDKISYYSICGKQIGKSDAFDLGWVEAKIPGNGDVNWNVFFNVLKDIAYNGVVSIEHEDLEYEGSVAKLKEGIGLGKKYLDRFFPVK